MSKMKRKYLCPYCESEKTGKIETDNIFGDPYYCLNCDEKFDTRVLDNGFLYSLSTKRYINEAKKELLKELLYEIKELKSEISDIKRHHKIL